MAAPGELTYVLDQNFSDHMLQLLRLSKMEPVGRITSLAELGFAGSTPDEQWLSDLGRQGGFCVVTRNGAILQASIQRRAWSTAGVSLLVLDKQWGQQPRRELSRRLLYWWPHMISHAEAGQPGNAWTVPHGVPDPPARGIRLVTGPGT
jgi:hypothetical protein